MRNENAITTPIKEYFERALLLHSSDLNLIELFGSRTRVDGCTVIHTLNETKNTNKIRMIKGTKWRSDNFFFFFEKRNRRKGNSLSNVVDVFLKRNLRTDILTHLWTVKLSTKLHNEKR